MRGSDLAPRRNRAPDHIRHRRIPARLAALQPVKGPPNIARPHVSQRDPGRRHVDEFRALLQDRRRPGRRFPRATFIESVERVAGARHLSLIASREQLLVR